MGNTPHFGWAYPVVGGSNDVWGDVLNLLFIAVDQALWALNPPVTGTIDNMTIGAIIPKPGTFAGLGSTGDLAVNGTATFNGQVNLNAAVQIASTISVKGPMGIGAVGTPGEIDFRRSSDGVPASRIFELPDASGTGLGLEAGGNSPMVFYVGGTGLGANPERMRIDSNGTVGVGTNVSGGWTGNARFEVLNNGLAFALSAYSTSVTPGAGAIITRVDNTNVSLIDFEYNGINVGRFITDGVGLGIAYPNRFSLQAPVTIYNPADSATALVVAGSAAAVRFGTSGTTAVVEGVDQTGTASYHSLQLGGSQVMIATGGPERMRIDAAGNVGIGLTNPLAQLDVRQSASIRSGAGQTAYLDFSGDSAGYQTESFTVGQAGDKSALLYQRANTAMLFATNATERMRIDAAGNVGIGVTPSFKLDVLGSIVARDNRNLGNTFGSILYGGDASLPPFVGTNYAGPFAIGTNSTERMRIDGASGMVTHTVTPNGETIRLTPGGAYGVGFGAFLGQAGPYLYCSAGYAAAAVAIGRQSDTNSSDGAFTPDLIVKNGNVGIGMLPVGPLSVKNPGDSSSAVLVSGPTNGVRIGTTAGGANIDGVDSTGSASYQPLNIGGSSLSLACNGAFPMTFSTNGAERMRIDANGHVGIGMAPNYILDLVENVNGDTRINLANPNTGSSATTGILCLNGTNNAGFQYNGTGTGAPNVLYVFNTAAAPIILRSAGLDHAKVDANGFFKASSTGIYPYGSFLKHEFYTTKDGEECLIVGNGNNPNPYGMMVIFAGLQISNASNYFFRTQDAATARHYLMTNGGIWNLQGNDVNFSDEILKDYITPYTAKELDGLQDSFCDVIWGKYKFRDQTHDDWNHGPTAQGIERAFALTAPELVDISDPSLDKAEAPHPQHKGIYETDLTNIGRALLARALKTIDDLKKRLTAAESKLAGMVPA